MKKIIKAFLSDYVFFYIKLIFRTLYISHYVYFYYMFETNLPLLFKAIMAIVLLIMIVEFRIFFEAFSISKSMKDFGIKYKYERHYVFYEMILHQIESTYWRFFYSYYVSFGSLLIVGVISFIPLMAVYILYSYISYFSFIFLIVATPLIREIYYKILKVDEFSTIKEYTEEEMAEHRKAYTSINFSALNYFKDSDMLFKLMFSSFLIGFIAFIVYFAVIS